jgi:hypothetical protein
MRHTPALFDHPYERTDVVGLNQPNSATRSDLALDRWINEGGALARRPTTCRAIHCLNGLYDETLATHGHVAGCVFRALGWLRWPGSS